MIICSLCAVLSADVSRWVDIQSLGHLLFNPAENNKLFDGAQKGTNQTHHAKRLNNPAVPTKLLLK